MIRHHGPPTARFRISRTSFNKSRDEAGKRLKENANDEKEVNQPELILTDDESSDEDGTELVMKELKEKSKERETNKEKERESEIAGEKQKK